MRLTAIVAAAALLAACGDDAPTEPEPNPNPSSRTIPTLGSGAIANRYTGEVTARGNYAYTSTWGQRNGNYGNAFHVWNVTTATPVLVETVVVPPVTGAMYPVITTGDIEVSDDGTLLAVASEQLGGSLTLYSLADPAHPTFLSQFHSADTDPGVHTAEIERVGGKLYAFLSIDPGNTPAKLVVLDLSTPATPVQVLARQMGNPFVHDVFVRDSLLFTALWDGGMTIWDIGGSRGGTPANPIFISNIQTAGGNVHNIWWYHDEAGGKRYVFVGEEGPASLFTSASGDIHVVDITNITAPQEVAFYTLAGAGTHNFWVDESSATLYAAYYNGGVRAIDITGDLATCSAAAMEGTRCNLAKAGREIGNALNGGFVWGVQGLGNRLYASDMVAGLVVLDISTFKR